MQMHDQQALESPRRPGSIGRHRNRLETTSTDPTFDKTSIIWTNDPALSEIHFEVLGKVALPFDVTPRVWDAGTVTEDANGKAIGYVTSDLDKTLKIVSIEPVDSNVRVEYRPMSAKDLDARNCSPATRSRRSSARTCGSVAIARV